MQQGGRMDNEKLFYFFSKPRLDSYESIDEHFENLWLIGQIAPKLGMIELILRNLLDLEMKKRKSNWLQTCNDAKILQKIQNLQSKAGGQLLHEQLLSNMSLGDVVRTINAEGVRGRIFSLQRFDFKKYDKSNQNRCLGIPKKPKFNNDNKAEIVLSLLTNIRNRAFHWENLFKTRFLGDKAYPCITTKLGGTNIGIAPRHIEMFLDDILETFDAELLVLAGGKKS